MGNWSSEVGLMNRVEQENQQPPPPPDGDLYQIQFQKEEIRFDDRDGMIAIGATNNFNNKSSKHRSLIPSRSRGESDSDSDSDWESKSKLEEKDTSSRRRRNYRKLPRRSSDNEEGDFGVFTPTYEEEFNQKQNEEDLEFNPKQNEEALEFNPKQNEEDLEFNPKQNQDDVEFNPKQNQEDVEFNQKQNQEDLEFNQNQNQEEEEEDEGIALEFKGDVDILEVENNKKDYFTEMNNIEWRRQLHKRGQQSPLNRVPTVYNFPLEVRRSFNPEEGLIGTPRYIEPQSRRARSRCRRQENPIDQNLIRLLFNFRTTTDIPPTCLPLNN